MQNTTENNKTLYYDMNNKHRGSFYINIEVDYNEELKENLSNWKTEITRLGFSKKITLNRYINGENDEIGKFKDDDCIALLNCVPKKEVKNELEILKQFHVKRGHSLHEKPRIVFMIYQVEKENITTSSKIQTDGEPPMMLPVEADMLIVRVETTNVSSAIDYLCNSLKTIVGESDIEDFLITFINFMKPTIVTTYNTLTRRLWIGPKEINKKMQEKRQTNEEFAGLLKTLIENYDDNERAQKLKEKYNIVKLYKQISENPYHNIDKREEIAKEVEDSTKVASLFDI